MRRIIIGLGLIFLAVAASAAELELTDPTQPTQMSGEYSTDNTASKNGLVLNGIIYHSMQHAVIINGKVFREGESIGNYTIRQIQKDFVLLADKKNNTVILKTPDIKQPV